MYLLLLISINFHKLFLGAAFTIVTTIMKFV